MCKKLAGKTHTDNKTSYRNQISKFVGEYWDIINTEDSYKQLILIEKWVEDR